GQHVDEGQPVDERDQEVERVDGGQGLGDRLHVDGDEQEGGDHHHPEEHQPLEAVLLRPVRPHPTPRPNRRAQLSLLMRSNSGRYMLMTMPPTVTPRKAIMTGSIRVSRLDTAWSTSSS